MRHIIRLTIAAAMSLSLATPGFAYVFSNGGAPERMSRRAVDTSARGANDISGGLSKMMRTRKMAESQENGLTKLRRASGRTRSANRTSGRMRTLHPNTRSLRNAAEGME
ncbi:MAG: hypothetical protein Greene041662_389 [Candidatus Peregrinibacteria bacterium Greene0416_62]|nr:MAG: hypothetical protein Greene041662_389 [Candidatus Peregrinibacteria bacterium Greene0416_62]TSC99546.1 MAG: hypothetical protein Greene101449_612 [Candidatus Peregrinibacteria bacterium Greene1014_49]